MGVKSVPRAIATGLAFCGVEIDWNVTRSLSLSVLTSFSIETRLFRLVIKKKPGHHCW